MEQQNYVAFISYRHYTPDQEIARRVHALIENYTIPAALRKEPGEKRLGKVFRDQEELPLSADLGRDIETALDNSRWFIAICSPRYTQSRWCMRELEYFITRHGRQRVLTVLAEGEPSESFPDILKHEINEAGERVELEPLAADARGSSLAQSLGKLKREKLRLLAPMLGTTFDGLYQRQRRRRIVKSALILCACALLLGAWLLYAQLQGSRLEREKRIAAQNECDALISQGVSAADALKNAGARELALSALALSDGLDGYRRSEIMQILAKACYAGDLSCENALDVACDLTANGALFTTEFFSPRGDKVLGFTGDSVLTASDAKSGALLWSAAFDGPITSARWSAGGEKLVVTAQSTHTLRVLDAQSGKSLSKISLPWVCNACFTGEEGDIFLCFGEGFLLWHTRTDPDAQQMEHWMPEVSSQGANARVFENGRYVLMHSEIPGAYSFGAVDTQTMKMALYEAPYPTVVNAYAISPDGQRLFVHQFDRVYVCDLWTNALLWESKRDAAGTFPDGLSEIAGPSPVWTAELIADSERSTDDYTRYTVCVYDAKTGEMRYTIENEYCVQALCGGEYLLCAHGIYRASDGALAAPFNGTLLASDAQETRYLSAGQLLTALGGGTQRREEQYAGSLYSDKNEMHRLVSPDGRYQVIENAQGFTIAALDGESAPLNVRDFTPRWWINFSPDSRLAALGNSAGEFAVYELQSGRRLFASDAWRGRCALGGFTFSAEGTLLMTASYAGDMFCVADPYALGTLYTLHATKKVADWGFDSKTGDAVVLYEDGSALIADIFTEDELIARAQALAEE